jgi:SWIM zinc finger
MKILKGISSWALREVFHSTLDQFKSDLELIKRVDRAYDILTRDSKYDITYEKESLYSALPHFIVTSPNAVYRVIPDKQSCTCPDAERSILCKHRLAVKMLMDASALQKAEKGKS